MKTADVIESGIRYFLNQNLPENLSCSPEITYVSTLKNKRYQKFYKSRLAQTYCKLNKYGS